MIKQDSNHVNETRAVFADSLIIMGREFLHNTGIPWIRAQELYWMLLERRIKCV